MRYQKEPLDSRVIKVEIQNLQKQKMKTLHPFNLSFSLSLLFMGFLFANFFGIITSTKSVIFVFIVCIELTNYIVYTQKLDLSSILPNFKIVRMYRLSKTQPSDTFPPPVLRTDGGLVFEGCAFTFGDNRYLRTILKSGRIEEGSNFCV